MLLATTTGAVLGTLLLAAAAPLPSDALMAWFAAVPGILRGTSDATIMGDTIGVTADTDCRDVSTGGGTSGTADTWSDPAASDSDPAGICGPAAP